MKSIKCSSTTNFLLRAAISGALFSTAATASAQGMLEEVVVTAQKRSERLIEVPISITTLSSETLEQSGVKELKELGDLTPNLMISQSSDFSTNIVIRGVGANSRNIGFDSRVGVYLDGVYLGQSPAANQGLVDLAQVEVLRGPQGTLFGKNTVAGAINLTSVKPGDEFEGSVGVNVGNYNNLELKGSANIPLTDSTAVKVYGNKTTRDGYIKNVFNGDKVNERDVVSGRVHLRTDFDSGLEMNISADYLEQDRMGFNGEPLTDTFGAYRPAEGADKYEISQQTLLEDKELKGASLTFDYELDSGYLLKSITARRDSEITYDADPDYDSAEFLGVIYTDAYEQTTQEFQIISPDGSSFKYVAGLYYYTQDSTTDRDAIAGLGTILYPPLGIEVPIAAFGIDPTMKVVDIDGAVDTESYAVFANGTYDLTDRITIGLGFRYGEETKDVDWSIDGSNSGAFRIATTRVKDSRSDTSFDPTASINYAVFEDSYIYARVSTGSKSGGYNLDFINVDQIEAGIEFDEETVTSYEVGYKGEFPEQSLRVGVALFYSEFEDYQVNQYVDLGGGRTALSITNAAEVITQGVEVDLTYQPTVNLQLTAALGLLDAEFDSFPGGGAEGGDASGNKLPYAPELTASLGAQYYYPLPSIASSLLLRADYAYTDGYYITASNDDGHTLVDGSEVAFGKVDSYGTVSARIGLVSDAETWEVSVWGRNLTDNDYQDYSFRDFFGTILAGYAMPRTYGIEAKYKF
ncbi:TonB-dependent receptor [Seongchinamella sediminis]|uniref:TonB-dependent receptor n=1 Tax=Seongchinamella sediminis TaxID=2283635 RepID=A0A3L7DY35_9GAMM|nr:TonB-dependent receptor [Seongchinamella sediminis]RLQ22507.1 TonB-dependent receptor [Seongchinamella sediminis]